MVEAIIDAQVYVFKQNIRYNPERDQNAWLAMTLKSRAKWRRHEDLYCYTRTALFSLASSDEAPVLLGTYIATKEIVSKYGYDFSNPYWLKYIEILNPIENLKTPDLLTRWREVNPWTATHFPYIENELQRMSKYAPTRDDLKKIISGASLTQPMTLEIKLDAITEGRVEQITRAIGEKSPNFIPAFLGIIFTYGFTLAINRIREEGSFLKGIEKLVNISCQLELENIEELLSARRKLLPVTLEIEVDGSLKRRIEDISGAEKNIFPESNEMTSEGFGNMFFSGFMGFRKVLSEEDDLMESIKKIIIEFMKEGAKEVGN